MNEKHPDQAFGNVSLIILSVQLTLLFICDTACMLYPKMVLFFPSRGCSDGPGYWRFAWSFCAGMWIRSVW